MKRVFLFLSVSVIAVAMSFTSCKAKMETNYVDLLLGRWRVVTVFPELPDKKYFIAGDEFVLNSDMTMVLDNNWKPYFSSTRWTLAYELDEAAYYVSMTGTHNEDEYAILFARIAGINDNELSLEYTDEATSTVYRLSLKRVTE